MRRHQLLLIAVLCCLLLAGCGTAGNIQQEAPEEPTATPEPLVAWRGEETDCLLPEGAENFCAAPGGFYCSAVERAGEDIPADVVNAAKRKGKEAYNDGRYDVFATRLYFIADSGEVTLLEEYVTLGPEENPDGWKGFDCVGAVEEITVTPSGKILTLEKNTVSGNSAPANRAQMVIGKNYREFHTVWYIRTLTETGSEIGRVRIDENSKRDIEKVWAGKKAIAAVQTVAEGELPFTPEEAGTGAAEMRSPVRIDGEEYTFIAGSGTEGRVITRHRETVTEEEAMPMLTLLCDEPFPALREAVDSFNASQKAAAIRMITSEEAETLGGADILTVTTDSMRPLAARGELADLYPLLDADEELDRSDYFENVLKAMEVDGKLVATCAGISLQTALAPADAVSTEGPWDYETLVADWGRFGLGTDAFDISATCYDVLRALLRMDLGEFADRAAGTCSFDNEKFTRLLSFAGNFRREYSYERYGRTTGDYTDVRLGNGKQMLQEKNICSFTDLLLCGYEYGRETVFAGYPTLSGSGSMMTVSTLGAGCNLAISAETAHQAEAWQFLRRFFTEEYQMDYPYLPVHRNAFNMRLSQAMKTTPVYDKNGRQVFDRTTGEPAIASVDTVYLSNFAQVNIYPVTEARAAQFVALLEGTEKIACGDTELLETVVAAASGYFDGTQDVYAAAAAVQEQVTALIGAETGNTGAPAPTDGE